jgi:Rps23 Pro-64 3,4-dihydroxylase Tpa1-like proline 4-hydroxylase
MYNISQWINKKYISRDFIDGTRKNIENVENVKVIIFDDFLNQTLAEKLKKSIDDIGENRSFSFNELGEMDRNSKLGHNQEYIPDNINHFFYKWWIFQLINWFLNSDEFLRYIWVFYGESITYQNRELIRENERKWGITFQDNVYIDIKWWHTDSETWFGKQKRWNILLYLTPEWQEEFWWCLELWKSEGNNIITYEKVAPIFNRLVLLISEENKSWHKIGKFLKEYQRIAYVNQILSSK